MSSPPPPKQEQQQPPQQLQQPQQQPTNDHDLPSVEDATGGGGELLPASDGEGEEYKNLMTKPPSRRVVEMFHAFNKGFHHLEVTPEATNPVKKDTTTRHGKVNISPCTPLRGIAGTSIQDIKIDDLRMFCSRNGVKGSRKAKKAEICWAICRARELSLEGRRPPYKGLMPPPDQDDDDADVQAEKNYYRGRGSGGNGDGRWDDGEDGSPEDRSSKKRRVEDAGLLSPAAYVGEAGGPQYSRLHQNELVHLQRRLVRSKESTNRTIRLRETVESASALRREMRTEKDRRRSLWKELVESVGDESLATTRVKGFRAAMANGEHPPGGGEVKGSYESLVEDVIEQDELVRKMAVQHVALIRAVDKLLDEETREESVQAP